jgi:hypothetical protein
MNPAQRSFAFSVLLIAGLVSAATGAEPERLRRWTNLSWEHWDYPLFSVYGPFDRKPGASAVSKQISGKKSVLDVSGFREVVLAKDYKGITIWLNEQDSRLLKSFAQKNPGQWLVTVAPPKDFFLGPSSVAVVPITVAVANGHISFQHPECASIAQSLRRRFRIAEFRLTPW